MTVRRCEAVLFDLDGTLVDSAPDLAGAANDLRANHGLPALAFEVLRPMVGAGARGMVGAAFGVKPGEPSFEPCATHFSTATHSVCSSGRVSSTTCTGAAGARAGGTALGHRHQQGDAVHRADRRRTGAEHAAIAALVAGDTTPHIKAAPGAAARSGAADRPAAGTLRLCRRRPCATWWPAAPPAWPRWLAAWGYLGAGATRARLGRRCGARAAERALELARIGLNCVPWGRPGFDVGAESDQGMPSTSSLVNPLETK